MGSVPLTPQQSADPNLPLTPQQIAAEEQQAATEGKIHKILVAFDQFCNSFSPGAAPDETISSHVRRVVNDPTAKHKLLAKVINWGLNELQPEHGAMAESGDLDRDMVSAVIMAKALQIPDPVTGVLPQTNQQ